MVTVNNNTYELRNMSSGDYMLIKNGEPVWVIPDELYEDFVQILSHAEAAARFLADNPAPKDDEQMKVNILTATDH